MVKNTTVHAEGDSEGKNVKSPTVVGIIIMIILVKNIENNNYNKSESNYSEKCPKGQAKE